MLEKCTNTHTKLHSMKDYGEKPTTHHSEVQIINENLQLITNSSGLGT